MLQIGDTFQDGGAVFKVKKFGADGALVGSVTWYAGAGTPENYLLCDGSAVSRTDYADLFAVIGTAYGAGDGSKTFNLPLLTDNRFIEGSNISGTQHEAGLPNHSHYSTVGTGYYNDWPLYIPTGTYSSRSHRNDVATGTVRETGIYGASDTVQPKALSMQPLIRYI